MVVVVHIYAVSHTRCPRKNSLQCYLLKRELKLRHYGIMLNEDRILFHNICNPMTDNQVHGSPARLVKSTSISHKHQMNGFDIDQVRLS